MMDSKVIHDILEKQIDKNCDKLSKIQISQYMKYQSDIQAYYAEHSGEPQEVSGKQMAEMTAKAMFAGNLESFRLGIQVGLASAMDLGESILGLKEETDES